MIHVNHGYVLTEAQMQTVTFQDSSAAVSRPLMVPKCYLLPKSQGGYGGAWKTPDGLYVVYNGVGDDAVITGAGPIDVETLHFLWHSDGRYYYYGDCKCTFRWYAEYVPANHIWQWYMQHKFEGGSWSTPLALPFSITDWDHDASQLRSYIISGGNVRASCLIYNRDYRHIAPFFQFTTLELDGTDHYVNPEVGSEEIEEPLWFGAILDQEPIAHNDHIHTVTGVVT